MNNQGVEKLLLCSVIGLILYIPTLVFSIPEIPFREAKKYRFSYEVEVHAPKEREGKNLSIWIPYPLEDEAQKILNFKLKTPGPIRITRESKHGNRMIYYSGKSSTDSLKFLFEYEILRSPYRGRRLLNDKQERLHYLEADRLVPLDSLIRDIAVETGSRFKKPSQKIRAFYDYVVKTMTYDKSGEGWGRGDALWACNTKRGNCTDFHSLFIGLSRSQKIPARFDIGFPLPNDQKSGTVLGYHCWAEAFAEDHHTWIPVDATEAKKTGKVNAYFGVLPSNRIHFTRGRDIILNPPQKGEPLNYFIYPYAELDGKLFSDIHKSFSFVQL